LDISYKLGTIDYASKFIINNCKSKLILFEGGLGTGKTTLIKQICRDLGSNNNVSSPSYPILNIYDCKHGNIFHADLYRVKNISDLNELGFLEILDLIPNILIALIAANTSSDNNKFFALDTPFAKEEKSTHLMLRLLSPLTEIILLNLFILSLMINEFDISN